MAQTVACHYRKTEAAVRSSHSTSTSTTTGLLDGRTAPSEQEDWAAPNAVAKRASKSSPSVSDASQQPSFDKANVDERIQTELDKNKISHRYRALEKLTAFLKLIAAVARTSNTSRPLLLCHYTIVR